MVVSIDLLCAIEERIFSLTARESSNAENSAYSFYKERERSIGRNSHPVDVPAPWLAYLSDCLGVDRLSSNNLLGFVGIHCSKDGVHGVLARSLLALVGQLRLARSGLEAPPLGRWGRLVGDRVDLLRVEVYHLRQRIGIRWRNGSVRSNKLNRLCLHQSHVTCYSPGTGTASTSYRDGPSKAPVVAALGCAFVFVLLPAMAEVCCCPVLWPVDPTLESSRPVPCCRTLFPITAKVGHKYCSPFHVRYPYLQAECLSQFRGLACQQSSCDRRPARSREQLVGS